MNPSTSGRGRLVVAAGAILLIVACFLQWWQTDTAGPGLPELKDIGISDGRVLLIFLAAAASLFLLTLPMASEAPVAIDHPLSFVVLFFVAAAGFVLRLISFVQQSSVFPFPPLKGPGFWVAALGLLILARGVFEVVDSRRA
ncbi:MAG TPA: hypothetical protein VIK06_04175 [Candidatus Limnocylindrales bacterium]